MNFLTELSATLLVTVMVVAVYGQGGSKTTGTKGRDVNIGAYDQNLIGVNIGEIHKSVKFGEQSDIGENNTIGKNCSFGCRVEIGNSNIIPQNSVLCDYVEIGHNNTFGRGLNLSEMACIGSNNKIGSDFYMGYYSTMDDRNSIGNGVRMLRRSVVNDNTKIMDGSILDAYSHVDSGSQIRYNVYLGKRAHLDERVTIKNGAVVHEWVLWSNATIGENEVVIKSPSSFELFQQSAPFDKVPGELISRDINVVLPELINAQFEKLNDNCIKGKEQTGLKKMPLIKSLYLIKYYGEEGFKSKYQEVSEVSIIDSAEKDKGIPGFDVINGVKIPFNAENPIVAIYGGERISNGVRAPAGGEKIPELENEIHFGQRAKKHILKSEVKRKFVQALAAELDFGRDVRVKNDTFCSMIEQIQSGKRKVRCDQSNRI